MKTKKMSLDNMKGKLSRVEMKRIIAGSGGCDKPTCEAKSNGGRTCVCTAGGQCVCVS